MTRAAASLVLLCALGIAVPAMAEEKTCDSPSRYKSGLNIEIEARDQDPAYAWRFVSGLTRQEKLSDSEASKTSDKAKDLTETYQKIYADRLDKSTVSSNKNILTRMVFEAPTDDPAKPAKYSCLIYWKTSKEAGVPGMQNNQTKYVSYYCDPWPGSPRVPMSCARSYVSDTYTVKLTFDNPSGK